jgi:hypothetical protein
LQAVHRRGGLLPTLALLVAGCGGGSTVTAGGGTPTSADVAPTSIAAPVPPVTDPATSAPAAAAPDRSASILPSVPMHDVGRGTTVDLASLIPAPRPVLLWFWAPH